MGVTVKLTGMQKAVEQMSRMAERTNDWRPFLKAQAELLEGAMSLNMRKATDPWGVPWKPLSGTTIALRRKNKKGRTTSSILIDSGKLREGLHARPEGEDAIAFGVSGPSQLYAPTHQFGRKDNRMFGKYPAPIPARPFLPVRKGGAPDFGGGGWAAKWMKRLRNKMSAWMKGGKL